MSFVSASSPECIDLENEEKEEVSKPLTSLQEILEWEKFVTPFQVESLQMRTEFSVRGSSFHCHSSKSSDWKHLELNTEDVPKTLVCHDMKGGYIEDRYIDGTETPDAYRFFHWAGIDTFVYFSHKLLTIPPPVWITAGHIHGVKVLGTLITEWDEGEIFWNMLLSNEKKRVSCVQKMVEICEKFGFDGYLLNVENKIPENDVPKLVKFVEELQEALHKKLPNSELVWYDSVISNGKLKWQNELNELNKLFFDACDGMLLNYPWREEHLERSAAAAGPARARDVYAGVDVFGRGSFGGGGFGAADALRAARRLGLSAALFAPGWTHEALGGGAHFACNEHLFWARLRPHLHVRGPARLPLRTSFCQGFGRRGRASWGRAPACPAARPWYHLGRQRLQPSVASCLDGRCTPQPERPPLPDPDAAQPPPQPQSAPSCGGANRGCVQHFEADAFDGGGCLQVRRAQDEGDDGLSLHRLFVCDLKSQSGRLVVVYAVKGVPCDRPCSERRSAELRLALVLRDSPSAEPRMMWVNDCNGHQVQRTSDGSSWEPFNSKTPQTSWQVWEYSVPVRGHVVEIIAGLPPGCKAALIGWLEITDAGPEEICDMSKNARENH